jgi:putative DNA primase/helicase
LVGAGKIGAAEVKAALTSAAQAAGLEGAEIQATIDSGLANGQAHPRDRAHPKRSQKRNLAQRDPLLGGLAKLGESDIDNGRRLVTRYGHRLHFVPERNQWFVFDGRVWREDTAKCRLRYAQDSARLISGEADILADEERRAARRQWAHQSLTAGAVRHALEMAQPYATRSITKFDAAPWLFNVQSGTIDLRTRKLRRHDPADYLMRIAGTDYAKDAKCLRFKRFLLEIFGGDKELIRFVQRYVGYTLTGEISEQCFLFCQGAGRNGKSTLVNIMQAMFGEHALATPTETLLVKPVRHNTNDLARLCGARMVSAIESNPNRQLDEALIKQITGGDRIAARFMYREFEEYTAQFKLWLVANHPPRVRSTDDALWRRIHVLPFDVAIPQDQVDGDLLVELRSELPGILAWAVRGCKSWQKTGLNPPARVLEATRRYREEVDHVRRFLQECVVSSDRTVTPSKILYERYERWCSENGERPVSMKKLADRLTDANYVRIRSAFSRGWQGLALRE